MKFRVNSRFFIFRGSEGRRMKIKLGLKKKSKRLSTRIPDEQLHLGMRLPGVDC